MTLNEVEGTEPATAMEMPGAPVTAEAETPAETGGPADTPAKATTEDIASVVSGAVSVESAAVPAETNGSAAGTAAPEAISAQASGATDAEVADASASALAGVSPEEAEAAPAAEEAVEAEPAEDAVPVDATAPPVDATAPPVDATAPPAETSPAETLVEVAAAPAETEAAPTEGASAGTEDAVEAAPVEVAAAPAAAAPAAERSDAEAPVQVAAAPAIAPPAAAPPAEPPAPAAAPEPPRPEPTTMEELLSEQSGEIRSLKHGDVVEGSVVRIDKDEILVDIGAKSEGVVSNRELYGRNAESQPQLNIGDVVLVYVLQPESNEGHAVLSLRRAGLERKWRAMQEQLDAGAIIEAPVIDHNKGGLIVDCGIRGFVPISQIVDFPRRPQNEQPRDAAQEIAEKLQPYVGRKLRLKILEVNRKANRLILSEKVALYEERREKRDELFSSLKVSQHVKGTVRSIAPFGVFVDLGGIDGLVHKSELSWNKVNNPESGYRVGEEVEAEVIDINHERGRISLSIRRLQPDPWHSTVADLKVGDVIEGTVTKIVNFGAFVRVREGLEGLIHISELSQARVAHPGDVVHEGQKLRLKVISLDSERHRLGLSLKQAEEAPPRPTAPEPRERRGRPERSYDMSQAVQEPEGGIDNTLAAAFAQVRQQMAEQDRVASQDSTQDEDAGTATETTASAPASDREVEAAAETAAAVAVGVEAIAAAEAESVVETELAAEIVELAEAEDAAEAEVEALAADMTESEANEVRAELAGVEAAAESELKARIETASEAEAEIEAVVAADAEALASDEPGVAETSVSAEDDAADRPVAQGEADAESAG